jgi:hypothetical protein
MSLPLPAEDRAEDPAADPRDLVDRPVLRADGPSQIVQLVPYILGFHPEDSLVLMAMRGRRTVASVRNDLDAPLELLEPWCAAVGRAGADRVVGVLYSDDVTGPPLPRRGYVARLVETMSAYELDAIDVLAVSDGRWWSYQCGNDSCCPPEGTPVDRAGALAASAVTEGMVALPSREELRRELAVDELAVGLVKAEVERLDDWGRDERHGRAEAWSTVRRFVKAARTKQTFTPAVAAPVLVALQDKHVRDAAMGYLVDLPDPRVREAWRRLTTMSPQELRAPPAVLYAMWCYASGSGARANMGIDVALGADPDYTMAHLLLELQMTAMNPFEVVSDMAREAARVGRRIQRRRHPTGRAPKGAGHGT